ncbi:MAG TPA: NAD(P)(+) transhydrogenase (Re/Si-specific) subunit alpha, partial [Hellea balneolensis]|nr:NAD(P)(+) transhydrogenase (Re/Si-specific) subunit alpha [Hellea balneolensis]
MKIAVLKESGADEARVAATPDAVKFYIGQGHEVSVTKGAGKKANFSDADFKDAGASIATTNDTCVKGADLVLSITGGSKALVAKLKKGAGITGLLNPTDNPDYAKACAKAGVTAYALEYIPRISRAQAMDVLSSQSNLA